MLKNCSHLYYNNIIYYYFNNIISKVRYKDIENKVNCMKKSEPSNNYGLDKFNETNGKYEITVDEIINLDSISKILLDKNKCPNCEKESFIEIKKFKPLNEQLDLNTLDDNLGRCSCGKRHIDIVMAQILKIMKEENIELRRFILRNGPTPLLTPMFNNKNEPFIEKNSLIILHPKFTKDIAKKIMDEVSEVKGVIKGDPKDTIGFIDINSEAVSYELLAGSDIRCDIVQTPVGEIVINKIQHLSYLEFPPSMENKIKKLWEYIQTRQLSKEEISNLTAIDGTCGNGTLGIFLLKLGFKKVIFNDIWRPSTVMTSINLNANGFPLNEEIEYSKDSYNIDNVINIKNIDNINSISTGNNFEVYNLPFEKLNKVFSKETFDICILDCFPGVNTTHLENIAKSLAKDVLII